MIGTTISHYKILEKIGEGGMGVVYKARDTRLDRLVALKFLPPHFLTSNEELIRFQQEAKALSALNHPHIATIYDIGQSTEQKFIVLEYLPGGTLRSQVKDLANAGRELSLQQIVQYGLQIAEGLSHAHRHGIVHRDLKTDNVMATDEGMVKITDFGLAKLGGTAPLTRTGSTVGTVPYMSPEQIRGEEIDHRSDIFSFGTVLYELATGRLPFRGEHDAAVSYSIVNEEPAQLGSLRPEIPSSLERVISRCVEKEKAKRYQSAEEIAADLRAMLQEFSGQTATRPASTKRSLGIAMAVAAALLLIGSVAVYFYFPGETDRAARKSIAVLPFKNLSEDKENEYFSDGITEDIITQLSKIADLRVTSRTSVMRHKGSAQSLREIGSELNVAVVLEGSVRRAGNRIRIVGQLIDAQTDEHLWAETYDRDLTDIFAIQSEVAQRIAAALKVTLSPTEKERLGRKPTDNLDAYSYYLKGREYYYHYQSQSNDAALELFKRALELDPQYALAYAGLGDAYGQRAVRFGFGEQWTDSAIVVSNKALALDENLAEAHKALGLAYINKGWYQKGLEANKRSVELNPSYLVAVGNIGAIHWSLGNLDESMVWLNRALALDPAFAFSYFSVGGVYLTLDDYIRARGFAKKALNIHPNFPPGYALLSLTYVREAMYQEAIASAEKILTVDQNDLLGLNLLGDIRLLSGDFERAEKSYRKAITTHTARFTDLSTPSNKTSLAFILIKTGRTKEGRALLDESMHLNMRDLDQENESFAIPYDIARIHAARGEKAEAYTWLQRSIDSRFRLSFYALADPLFENLHSEDRFKQMMQGVKQMVDTMRRRVEMIETQEK